MAQEFERWMIFATMTAAMLVGTIWHFRQQRSGVFKANRWLGELLVGHQVITDRTRNPVRFRMLKWLLGAALAGCWIGWCFLLRAMIG